MKELFSYTKLFTILLSIFYISGLISCFFELEILSSFLIFIVLSIFIWALNLDFKKAIILYSVFFIGLFRADQSLNLTEVFDEIYSNNVIVQGQVISSKNISANNGKTKFYLKSKSAEILGKKYNNISAKVLISGDNALFENVSIGDCVKIKGKLRHPSPATNPYQFDYQNYLLNNDVKDIIYADSFEKVGEVDFKSDKWFYILAKFEKTRNDILEKHSKYIKSPRLEILGGIVFGSEAINPSEEIKENFKNSGLLHLLAASGLNVALIYGIWWWIANLIRFPYNLSILVGAVFVIFYTFMTGFPPSILRASIMLLFVLLGKIIDRNANSLALIFFVGFLILLISPKMLFDVGFQLSFVVTIGLVVCVPIIILKFEKLDKKYKERYKKSSRIIKYSTSLFSPSAIVGIVAVPLVAQLCVMPLQMYYFNNFTPFSLLANIAVIPFIGVLSFIGFISSIFALIPILNESVIFLFDMIANPLLALLIKISEFFSSFKYSLVTTAGLNIFQISMFWLIGLTFILNLKNNFKNKKQVICFFACLILFFASFIQFNNKNLEILMFDVGNADSFLIKTPKNSYIMIDTGKKPYKGISDAQMILNKYLKNKRISKIEKLIVTHFDLDHSAGVIDILKENKVNNVIIKNEIISSQISAQILKYLKDNKINYTIAKNDEIIYQEDNIVIKTFIPKLLDDNESSIITLLTYKNKNLLFMADSGFKGYENIKNKLPKNIEILKIGHHGAKNSVNKKMIDDLNPKYALISVGYNKFNHPHHKTLEILQENDIKIISTRNYGFSKFNMDENKAYFYDNKSKKLKEIIFELKSDTPFHKSEFIQNFINNHLQ